MDSKEAWKLGLDDGILDSGNRTTFKSGAVRDIQETKGRCDLLPLRIIADKMENSSLIAIARYIEIGDLCFIWSAINDISGKEEKFIDDILDVSILFKQGAEKYGERNWEKGIPAHSYIDSGVRHYLKYLRGDADENHKRAFIWNMLCLIHTHKYLPEMLDLPFAKKEVKSE